MTAEKTITLDGVKAKEAERCFKSGCNCCQAVVMAFAPELGLPEETLLRLSSSFGGGVGRMREICGAVSGMAIVLGLLRGYSDLQDKGLKAAHYDRMQGLCSRFLEANGSLRCGELLGEAQGPKGPVPGDRTPQYYQERPCPRLVAQAAALLEEELARDK